MEVVLQLSVQPQAVLRAVMLELGVGTGTSLEGSWKRVHRNSDSLVARPGVTN